MVATYIDAGMSGAGELGEHLSLVAEINDNSVGAGAVHQHRARFGWSVARGAVRNEHFGAAVGEGLKVLERRYAKKDA